MNKVYFDSENNKWFVDDLEELYLFKVVNYKTNEEHNSILTWNRNFEIESESVRIYDVEIEEIKYYFLLKSNSQNSWDIISQDQHQLEELLERKGLFFSGEVKIIQ